MQAKLIRRQLISAPWYNSSLRNLYEKVPVGGSIDVRETHDAYKIETEIPGFTKKQLQLKYVDSMKLILSGSNKKNKHFERTIPLHCPVDPLKAKAKLHHGMLHVELPKNKAAVNVAISDPSLLRDPIAKNFDRCDYVKGCDV
jgi:HSP20 family molecular chaperone IbpA